MKRSLFTFAAATIAAGALGQNFTIVRPPDGAHVREKVHILFPKGSVPHNGYIGIFLNGQLIDATVPTAGGKFSEYILDTKGRIENTGTQFDGMDRFEARVAVREGLAAQGRVVWTLAFFVFSFVLVFGGLVIGRRFNVDENVFIATGDSGNGGVAFACSSSSSRAKA